MGSGVALVVKAVVGPAEVNGHVFRDNLAWGVV